MSTLSSDCTHSSSFASRLDAGITRVLDCIVALVCLVVFSPVLAVCAILIWCEDRGPVIYKQERIGYKGRPFYILKFRTMHVDAEENGPQLAQPDDTDKRLLRVGRILRKHHIDEFPQFWNVVRGDMAFVGPRPERAFYIRQIMEHDSRYECLYAVRPGVTSYATIYNGYTDTMEKMLRRLELDLYYLEHRSLWFNAKILWLTFYKIFSGRVF